MTIIKFFYIILWLGLSIGFAEVLRDFTNEKKFNLEGTKRPDRLFINENEALIQMFSSGMGYGTLTEDVAKPFIERGELMVRSGDMGYSLFRRHR